MARFCFYCGRELSNGEKCNCRTTGSPYSQAKASGPQSSEAKAGAGPAASQPNGKQAQASKRKGSFKRFVQAFNPFSSTGAARQQSSSRPRQPKASRPIYQKTKPKAAGIHLNPQSIFLTLRQIGQYIIHPADSIRQAQTSGSRHSVLLILLLQGLCGGLFLLTATNQTFLRSLLALNIASASQSYNFLNSLFIFLQGFGISLAASLLLVLIYQLVLRYLFRQSVGFLQILISLSPSCLYFTLFMLAGLLALPASFFSALMMLLAGFAIGAIAQYLALRQMSGFDDNRSFMLITFVMLLYTGALAMLLNLSLPVIRALFDQSIVI